MKIFSNTVKYPLMIAVIVSLQLAPNFALAESGPIMSLDEIQIKADNILSRLSVVQEEINLLNSGVYTNLNSSDISVASTSCNSLGNASNVEKCASDFGNITVVQNNVSGDNDIKNMANVLSAVKEILFKIMEISF